MIFESKKTGKGRLGRGKIFAEMMSIIADCDGSADIAARIAGNIDRFLLRVLRGETMYPYTLFSFSEFEKNIGNKNRFYNYIAKMKKFCDEVIDNSKIEQLTYTLLALIHKDNDVEEIKCLLDAKKIYTELYDNYKVQTVNLRLAKAYSNSFKYQKSDSLFRSLINSQDTDSLIYIYALNGYAFLKATQSDLQSDIIQSVSIFDQTVSDNPDCMTTQDYWAYAYVLNLTGRSKESAEIVNQLISIDTTSSTPYWMYRIAKYNNNLSDALKYLEESNSKDSDVVTDILNQAIALVQRDYYESESELAEYKAKGRTNALVSVIIICLLILM